MGDPTDHSAGAKAKAAERPSWYQEHVGKDEINDEAYRLLEEYSGLTPEEVLPHVLAIVSTSLT